jgi:BASS family bile acid:Na+ symporter
MTRKLCGPVSMALGLLIGVAVPPLAAGLALLIGPLMAVVLFLTVLRTDLAVVAGYAGRPRLPLILLACVFLVSPALTALAALLPLPPGLGRALVLNSATPPILGAPAAAMVLGFSVELSLVCMVTATLLAPLTITIAVWLVSGGEAAAQPLEILWRVLMLTALPAVCAVAVRRMAGEERLARAAPSLQCLIVAGLALLAIGLMDGANQVLARGVAATLPILIAALAFNLVHQGLFHALFAYRDPKVAGVAAIMAGNRNLGLTQAGLGPASGDIFSAYVALGQIPIYLTPMLWRLLLRNRAKEER